MVTVPCSADVPSERTCTQAESDTGQTKTAVAKRCLIGDI
jgi:hypothetical protein